MDVSRRLDIAEEDRRAHERVELARACKLHVPAIGRYVPGTTWNLSGGGALLEVDRPLDLRPGQRVSLGVAMKRRQAVLYSSEMFKAEVIRASGAGDRRTVLAVRFLEGPIEARQAA